MNGVRGRAPLLTLPHVAENPLGGNGSEVVPLEVGAHVKTKGALMTVNRGRSQIKSAVLEVLARHVLQGKTGGTSTEGTRVKAFNRTTAEFVTVTADGNTASINLANLSSDGTSSGTFSGFANTQVIEVRCTGGRMGSGTYTIASGDRSKGGGKVAVTVVDVTATNSPGVSV